MKDNCSSMFYTSLQEAWNDSEEDNPLHRGVWSVALAANTSPVLTRAGEPSWSNYSINSLQ